MSNILSIQMSDVEGAMTRLIGLIERRGFSIASIDKSEAAAGQSQIVMSVSPRTPARRLDVLTRQIARLFDVSSVQPVAAMATARTAHGRSSCRPPN